MTTTTTIRLETKLKKRIERLAKKLDQTPHSLMVEELAAAITAREEEVAWELELDRRQASFDRTQRGIPHEQVRTWFEQTARGERVPVPAARKIPRVR